MSEAGPLRQGWRQRAVVVLLATLIGMAVTGRLGLWQLDRAAQKEALQQSLDARATLPAIPQAALATRPEAVAAQVDRPVQLRGHWLPQATVFLDNRQMNGRPGFFVMTPLRLEADSANAAGQGTGAVDAVVVQRGWVPRDALDRKRLPLVPTPEGLVELQGRIAPPPARLYDFAGAVPGVIRQNLDLDAFARETGLRLRPVSVIQEERGSPVNDGLLRQWPRPAVDVHKHYGYAFQWFALCALMAGLYVWFQLLRPRFRRAV